MFGLGVPLTFLIIAVAALVSGIKILKEYQRSVVFMRPSCRRAISGCA